MLLLGIDIERAGHLIVAGSNGFVSRCYAVNFKALNGAGIFFQEGKAENAKRCRIGLQFLHDEMQRFKPDLIVSIHAPYGVLDFDGPVEPPQRLGRLRLVPVGVFPGSLGNYSGVFKNVPVVTIELPSALLTPRDAEIERMWLDLHRWMGETLISQIGGMGPQKP